MAVRAHESFDSLDRIINYTARIENETTQQAKSLLRQYCRQGRLLHGDGGDVYDNAKVPPTHVHRSPFARPAPLLPEQIAAHADASRRLLRSSASAASLRSGAAENSEYGGSRLGSRYSRSAISTVSLKEEVERAVQDELAKVMSSLKQPLPKEGLPRKARLEAMLHQAQGKQIVAAS